MRELKTQELAQSSEYALWPIPVFPLSYSMIFPKVEVTPLCLGKYNYASKADLACEFCSGLDCALFPGFLAAIYAFPISKVLLRHFNKTLRVLRGARDRQLLPCHVVGPIWLL